MKLRELVDNAQGFHSAKAISVKASLSFKIAQILKQVLSILRDYEEQHGELLKKYGTPLKDDPGRFSISPLNAEDYIKERDELLDVDVEITAPEIKMQAFESADIPVAVSLALQSFVKD